MWFILLIGSRCLPESSGGNPHVVRTAASKDSEEQRMQKKLLRLTPLQVPGVHGLLRHSTAGSRCLWSAQTHSTADPGVHASL